MFEVLRDVEWTCEDPDSKYSALFCPRCGSTEGAGHAKDCALAKVLRTKVSPDTD